MAMTAHAVFECSDDKHPVTTSKKALTDLIRDDIGFDGLLMSAVREKRLDVKTARAEYEDLLDTGRLEVVV